MSIKMDIGCTPPPSRNERMKVRGRDLSTGFPSETEVDSEELSNILSPVVSAICEMIESTLEESPPELAGDIMERGIYLTGGGSTIVPLLSRIELYKFPEVSRKYLISSFISSDIDISLLDRDTFSFPIVGFIVSILTVKFSKDPLLHKLIYI